MPLGRREVTAPEGLDAEEEMADHAEYDVLLLRGQTLEAREELRDGLAVASREVGAHEAAGDFGRHLLTELGTQGARLRVRLHDLGCRIPSAQGEHGAQLDEQGDLLAGSARARRAGAARPGAPPPMLRSPGRRPPAR